MSMTYREARKDARKCCDQRAQHKKIYDGCTDGSECYLFNISRVDRKTVASQMVVFPNT